MRETSRIVCLVMSLVLLSIAAAQADVDYPQEILTIVEQYPGSSAKMTARDNEDISVILAVRNVSDPKIIFDFYKKVLLPKGWAVDSEMNAAMLSAMHLVKGKTVLAVGIMSSKDEHGEGSMVTLTLTPDAELAKEFAKLPDTPKKVETKAQEPAKENAPVVESPEPEVPKAIEEKVAEQPETLVSGGPETPAAPGDKMKEAAQPAEKSEYTDNKDGSVTHQRSGLIWQKADDGALRTWHEGKDYCGELDLAGRTDWSLPEKKQLLTLLKDGGLPGEFSGQTGPYWTSDTKSLASIIAWTVDFGGKKTALEKNKAQKFFVRCVSGGK